MTQLVEASLAAGDVAAATAALDVALAGDEVSLPLDRYPLARSRSVDDGRRPYSNTATPTRVQVILR